MMASPLYRLLGGQCQPSQLSLEQWNLLLQQGRSAQVLGTLAARLKQRQQWAQVPEDARWPLQAALVVAEKYRRDALAEVNHLLPVFNALEQPLILLKGAAYALSERPFAQGRTFSDLDVLVCADVLPKLESMLTWYGWRGIPLSRYDQRYYRQWMHEIPPLRHQTRHTVIDIHHALLPLTARLKPAPPLLMQELQPLANQAWVLSDRDQLLHSATHLFMDSELNHSVRDLLDFDGLVRTLQLNTEQWHGVIERARQMDLLPPLYYALRYSQALLFTPIPQGVIHQCRHYWQPRYPALMDWLFKRSIRAPHPSTAKPLNRLAGQLLFVRGHYLRMPLELLICHLGYKAWLSLWQQDAGD